MIMPLSNVQPVIHRVPGLFEIGRNCSALAHARRVALLVDGEAYFRAFVRAAERATRSIVILAWDFNSSTCLHLDGPPRRGGPPPLLGDFLNWLARRRFGLRVYVLDWDYPMVFGADREFPPLYGLGWKQHRRVHVAYDNTHPVGGSHHQKIVVIDDAMAFVGGFDLTDRRWDTSAHCAEEVRRGDGRASYPPFHDVMMAVDGEAARALGRIARARWEAATDHALGPVNSGGDPWPPDLKPDVTHVEVAVARTMPAIGEHPPVHEVETLYLDMIAAARRAIYIENQYFTAYRVGEALAKRLTEPDGPEIVVVSRLLSHGWLEEHTMHVLRTRLVERLREADRYGRFRIYYAHIDGLKEGTCIDVHSKLMIVDDEILRIGSANLCNRSMGMDSECDAAFEARGDPRVSGMIRGFRNRLLGEHLDVPPAEVQRAVDTHGTLRDAIEALRDGGARTLHPLEQIHAWPDSVISLARVADPEAPVSLDQLVDQLTHQPPEPRPYSTAMRIIALLAIVAAFTALWRYTPLAGMVDTAHVTDLAREFANRPWAPLVILVAYTPACVVMFPRPLITLAAVVAFGPVLGFFYAMSGILIAAWATYAAGRRMSRDTVRRLAGDQLNKVTETLRHHGLVAVTALRLVPVAPFSVEGLVAGAIHLKRRHFLGGTFLGMLPGTLAATVFGHQIETGLRDPGDISYGLLAGIAVTLFMLSLVVRRWLTNQQAELERHGAEGERAR